MRSRVFKEDEQHLIDIFDIQVIASNYYDVSIGEILAECFLLPIIECDILGRGSQLKQQKLK